MNKPKPAVSREASRPTASSHRPVPLFVPYTGPEVQEAARQALEAGFLGQGELTRRFEEELSSWLGLEDRFLVALSSCTAAIQLGVLLAGTEPGDEVICPAMTYCAGLQAVTATGAKIVFADCEEETLGIDPEAARELLSDRTTAIMPMHYTGVVCKIDEINALATEANIRVVEDAAQALGSTHNGRAIGTFGDLTCFSFDPVKVITTLEGGAIVTPNEHEVQRLQQYRLLGIDKDTQERMKRERQWDYDVVQQGFRFHLGSIPAAIGLAQLAMIETLLDNRRHYCERYSAGFDQVPAVRTLRSDFSDTGPFVYAIRVPEDARADLIDYLRERGIATGIHWIGAHEFTHFKDCRRGDLTVTEQVARETLTLPLWGFMKDDDVDHVIDCVTAFFQGD
ncbi:MAG: DegT/DnrJ/EryC1/StrS family aminotransferase [Gaiellaceae bacterium]